MDGRRTKRNGNDSYLEDAYRGALENDPANEWNID